MANLFQCAQSRKTDLRPVQNQTGHKIRTGFKRRSEKRPTGRVDHIGANHKTCRCRRNT
jgi:hypothetical protein